MAAQKLSLSAEGVYEGGGVCVGCQVIIWKMLLFCLDYCTSRLCMCMNYACDRPTGYVYLTSGAAYVTLLVSQRNIVTGGVT